MKVRRSIWISAALVIAVSLILIVIVNAQNEAITFQDSNLEAMVRDQLGKAGGTIYKTNIEKVETLSIASNGSGNTIDYGAVKDLTDLKHFTGLKMLIIADTEVKDLSPLSSLNNLQAVFFIGCNITADLASLSNLPSLRALDIRRSPVSDLSPLGNMTNLNELCITGLGEAGISALSALSHLTNLTTLKLFENNIQDISPLSNLTGLTELDLSFNEISDIAPLSNLTNLTTLRLDNNQISDIASLSQLTNLTTLGLSNNQISDISPLVESSREGNGDSVILYGNPLSEESVNVYIPQLRAMGFYVSY